MARGCILGTALPWDGFPCWFNLRCPWPRLPLPWRGKTRGLGCQPSETGRGARWFTLTLRPSEGKRGPLQLGSPSLL